MVPEFFGTAAAFMFRTADVSGHRGRMTKCKMEDIMKKAIVIMLTGAMMVAAVACGGGSTTSTPAAETQTEEAAPAEESEEVESTVDESAAEEVVISEDAMTYEAYAAAAVDTEVVVEGGVQAKQSYYADNGTANVYLQDETGGAYFLYNLPCTQKEYDLLEVGSKIKVKGYKAEWSGEVEVIDAQKHRVKREASGDRVVRGVEHLFSGADIVLIFIVQVAADVMALVKAVANDVGIPGAVIGACVDIRG